MAPKTNSSSLSKNKSMVIHSTPAPPRPITHKIFEFLTQINLKNTGHELCDIPYSFGRELVVHVGTIPCPIPSETDDSSSGLQDKILKNPEITVETSEPCSSLPLPETSQRTGDVFVEDLSMDLQGDSEEESPVLGDDSVPLTSQTGEKRKRVKMVARRKRTPRPRPPSRSCPSSTPSSPPSRKSARIAFQSTPKSSKSSVPFIQEISSSSSEGFSDSDSENNSFEQGRPVFFDIVEEPLPQTTPKPVPKPAKTPLKKKPRTSPPPKATTPVPATKRPKQFTPSPLTDQHAKLLKRNVVRGKVVNVDFFQEQGVGVFLTKLRTQGWLQLFANTQLGCSVPELVEFYANCSVTNGVVTSSVSGQSIKFDASSLGQILGIPSQGFEVYVREDKTALEPAQLLEVSKRLSRKQGLKTPSSVKKGDLIPPHQLLFMFVIKNMIPRGQGRNSADLFDQCLVDLLDREEPINLPAIMIRHIGRIANTSRAHDLGYGFLLTKVFEHFGIVLTRRVAAQTIDDFGVDTLLGCGYEIEGSASKQGRRPPRPPVSGQVEAVLEDNARLKKELSAVKAAFAEEQARSAKRHEDLLALLSTLAPSIPPLQTKPPPAP